MSSAILTIVAAYTHFIKELNELSAFFKATTYSYDQTEKIIQHWKKSKKKFGADDETGLIIDDPHFFRTKRSSSIEIRKNLSEIVFVRVISSLEVFLVDLIRDAFLANKEPFKKQDVIIHFNQAELLSIKSPAEIFNKVINRECRMLSSGGFSEIIKYYKKNFDIDLGGFTPGKIKMEEYHDRRHLLVHRLGHTDQHYRDKYNTTKAGISINESYLFDCIGDFKTFSEMAHNQIVYKLKTKFVGKQKKEKAIERKIVFEIKLLNNHNPEFLQPAFEFWASDNFIIFSDILDNKKQIDEGHFEFDISGTFQEIKSFTRIIRRAEKLKEVTFQIISEQIAGKSLNTNNRIVLDEEILNEIKEKLPAQPWEKGIHKIVAMELNVTNQLVSIAIQQLIAKGIFKQQVDGVVIDESITNVDV